MGNVLKVSNIKISIKTKVSRKNLIHFKNNFVCGKQTFSFFVYRHTNFILTIYYNGHINLTGIRDISRVKQVITFLHKTVRIKRILSLKIDNSTVTGQIKNKFLSKEKPFLYYICAISEQDCFDSVTYRRQIFPGAFLKVNKCGTIVIFSSGKFNIVGCKNAKQVILLLNKLLKCIISIGQA